MCFPVSVWIPSITSTTARRISRTPRMDCAQATPVCSASHDHTNLILDGQAQRSDRNNDHESHRETGTSYCSFQALPSQVATARRPIPASSWFAAPNRPQILPYPCHTKDDTKNNSQDGCKVRINHNFLPAFFYILQQFRPGSSQNSWNMKRARRVAVSREVRQNAE